jgi:hypothetical protein
LSTKKKDLIKKFNLMKKTNFTFLTRLLSLGVFVLVCGLVSAQTYTSTPGSIISATNPGGRTNDAINVPLAGTIGTDYLVDEVTIDISHSWSGDLEIQLVGPGGTAIPQNTGATPGSNNIWLSENKVVLADNFTMTNFTDDAATCIASRCCSFYRRLSLAEGSNLRECNFTLQDAFNRCCKRKW